MRKFKIIIHAEDCGYWWVEKYDVNEPFEESLANEIQPGLFSPDDTEVVGFLESLGQSDYAPPFMYMGDSKIKLVEVYEIPQE